MSKILLSNVKALLPEDEGIQPADILLEDGRIKEVIAHSPAQSEQQKKDETSSSQETQRERNGEDFSRENARQENVRTQVDLRKEMDGKLAVPGLIDMHTHLRDPGQEHKETIKSGTEAAVRGGFTSVAAMPNTSPVIDNKSLVESVYEKAEQEAAANVYQVGAITKGSKGEQMAELGRMRDGGAVAVSDDGQPVMDSKVMRLAMEYSKAFNLPVISHCEDISLSGEGVVHEGYYSTLTGLNGIPGSAETIMVARDICLADETKCHLHIAHVSTAESLDLIRRAKKRGVRITCEVTPHHFSLTDESITTFNTNCKVNPPLRPRSDVEALKGGLEDGTIDVIATDHAPHTTAEKNVEFDFAPFGISGLETALGLVFTNLIEDDILSTAEAIKMMTEHPAEVLDIERGKLKAGWPGDVTVIDDKCDWEVCKEDFHSRGKNTPFEGDILTGKSVLTAVDGRIAHEDDV